MVNSTNTGEPQQEAAVEEEWHQGRYGSRFEGEICGYTRKTKHQMNKHMERSHVKENIPEHLPGDNREEYNCDKRDFQSNNNIQLRKHIELKHRSNFQFDNCDIIILGSKTDLDAHIQEKHKSYRPF